MVLLMRSWLFLFLKSMLFVLMLLMMYCFLLHFLLFWLMLMMLMMSMMFVMLKLLMMFVVLRFLMHHIFMTFDMNWCRLMLFLMFNCFLLRWLFYSVFLVVLSCGLLLLVFSSVEHQSLCYFRGFSGVLGNLNELGFLFILEVLLRQSLMSIIFLLLFLGLNIFLDVLGLVLHNPDFCSMLSLVVVLLFRYGLLGLLEFLRLQWVCGWIGHDAFAIGGILILALAVLSLINVHNLLRQLLH